jgi:hypothetical protein
MAEPVLMNVVGQVNEMPRWRAEPGEAMVPQSPIRDRDLFASAANAIRPKRIRTHKKAPIRRHGSSHPFTS